MTATTTPTATVPATIQAFVEGHEGYHSQLPLRLV